MTMSSSLINGSFDMQLKDTAWRSQAVPYNLQGDFSRICVWLMIRGGPLGDRYHLRTACSSYRTSTSLPDVERSLSVAALTGRVSLYRLLDISKVALSPWKATGRP